MCLLSLLKKIIVTNSQDINCKAFVSLWLEKVGCTHTQAGRHWRIRKGEIKLDAHLQSATFSPESSFARPF